MSLYHYTIIELDLPEVVGTCTINGNPGFSTPLTCTDQNSYSTTTKTHKFTDTSLILAESDIYKCVEKVSETTPKLKAGNGVASRATCSITVNDFLGDPNPTSPALVASPAIRSKGTFFGKLKSRNILANKNVRVKYYQQENGTTTLIKTNHYIASDIKRVGAAGWVITCKDILYKADDERSQFPRIVTGRLAGDITAGTTSVTIDADIADWSSFDDYTAVIGKDLLMITNATGTSSSVTLTVARASTITLGSRTILNTPESHSSGDEVFRGRKFLNADLYDVLVKIFEDADISTSNYDGAGMAAELNEWLASVSGSIDAIYYEPEESTSVLDAICSEFMLDMWTDTSIGKIKLKASSPWNSTLATLKENAEINYKTVKVSEPQSIYYSRAFLQYDKRKLTDTSDDVSFARSSLAFSSDYEGADFYDEQKVKKLGKSIILSNRTSNIEVADLTAVRYAQRFSNRPQQIDFEVEEANLNFELGDVIEITTLDNQDFYGAPAQGVRTQVTQISPINQIGRSYKVSTITFNPFIGGVAGSDLAVHSEYDNNLFTIAGGPVSAGTYTFVFDKPYFGQNKLNQAITVGSFPSGSTLNLVFINDAVAIGAGGDGGNVEGLSGGTTLVAAAGLTLNIYLKGTTPDFGNGTYTAQGKLFAPGGGGGAYDTEVEGVDFFAGGGGGAGHKAGAGGEYQGEYSSSGESGTALAGGSGGASGAGDGGGPGETGGSGTYTGGAAGKAIIANGATVNIYTDGETTRFIQGTGDAPTAIT